MNKLKYICESSHVNSKIHKNYFKIRNQLKGYTAKKDINNLKSQIISTKI